MAETDMFAQTQQQVTAPQSLAPPPVAPAVTPTTTGAPQATPLPQAVPSNPFALETKKFDPITSTVDKPTETVQGQLKNLFDEGNPLMVQAKKRAEATAAGRGLQNSSLAVGAAQNAQIAAAMPIAQQDAATYSGRAQLNNQTANQYNLNDQAAQANLNQLREQGNVNAYMTGLQAGYERDLAVLNGNITKDIHALDAANKLIEMAKAGDIEAGLMAQKFGFDSSLSAQENLQKLEQLVKQGDINAQLMLNQFNYDSLMKDKELGNALQLEDKRIQGQQNAILLEYSQRGILTDQEAKLEMDRLNQQHQNTLEQIKASAEASGLEGDKNRATELQAQYLSSVTARQSAASSEIAQIYSTPKLSATQQNTGVANAYKRLNEDLALLSKYYSSSSSWETTPASTPAPPANNLYGGIAPTYIPGGKAGAGTR